jgi:hypothetical protein
MFGTSGPVHAGSLNERPAHVVRHKRPRRNPAQPVRIVVMATPSTAATGEPADPCAACGLPAAIKPDSPPWDKWVSFGGTRLTASSPEESVPVYAARIPNGEAVLVANNGEEKANFDLEVKLGRGVYTVERWVLDSKTPETNGRIDRLESVVLGGRGTVEKPGWLLPGSLAVYKFTNRCLDVQSSFDAVRAAVRAMAGNHGGACRVIMVPLHECEAHLGSLSKGIRPEKRYDSLRYIHRALLTVGHAQALAKNFRGEGRLPQEGAERLDAALDHLQIALTDLSAGCLNLLPSLTVAEPEETHPDVRAVTVQLANAGQQSISLVRLGAEAPAGASVEPAERAMFDVLKPGETARATFNVRLPTDSPTSELTAEFAWFAARSPAHLRLKSSLRRHEPGG